MPSFPLKLKKQRNCDLEGVLQRIKNVAKLDLKFINEEQLLKEIEYFAVA